MKELEPLLSARDVADLFGRHPRTLTNWEHDGILIPIRLRTRRYYRRSDVEALLGIERTEESPRFSAST